MGKDGWIEWGGGECPVTGGVEVCFRNGWKQKVVSGTDFRWDHSSGIHIFLDPQMDIVAYRTAASSFGVMPTGKTLADCKMKFDNIECFSGFRSAPESRAPTPRQHGRALTDEEVLVPLAIEQPPIDIASEGPPTPRQHITDAARLACALQEFDISHMPAWMAASESCS
jgi:hypothetical protein